MSGSIVAIGKIGDSKSQVLGSNPSGPANCFYWHIHILSLKGDSLRYSPHHRI